MSQERYPKNAERQLIQKEELIQYCLWHDRDTEKVTNDNFLPEKVTNSYFLYAEKYEL